MLKPLLLRLLCAVTLLSSAARAADVDTAKRKLVILDVQSSAADATAAKLLGAALARSFGELHKGEVITVDEARALLDAKAHNELLGCADPRCARDLGNLLAADEVLASTYGVIAGQAQLAVTLLDVKQARVLDRWTVPVTAGKDGSVGATRTLALRALNPAAAVGGDQALKELRTAVVINEIGTDGAPLSTSPLSTCVQQRLIDAEVPVVSALQIARIKAQLKPELKGADALGSLTAGEVDVVVVGTVKYATVGKVGTRTAVRAGLTFEVIKVDTGEVIAATSAAPMQNAVTPDTAIELAAKLACTQLTPTLQTAMNKRLERGNRIVVEVPLVAGTAGATVANDIVAELLAEKAQVARAAVKSIDDKRIVIDAVLRGIDGVALALALSRDGRGDRVVAAAPGSLTLRAPSVAK